jgi:hypothetical protein
MTRVIVHIGSQHVASMAIPRSIFANEGLLAERGVMVPTTGRLDMSGSAVRHHLLAWSLDPDGEHPYQADVWDKLAEEIAATSAPTVLLSSELLATYAVRDATREMLRDRLRMLGGDVTVAFMARDQLGLLNNLYVQRVRSLQLTADFDDYLADTPDIVFCRLAEAFQPWHDDPDLQFVAMPWDDDRPDHEALPALLRLCEIDGAEELVAVDETLRDDLGAVGVEATRMLGAYLRGKFPNFSFAEPAARRVRRRAAALSDEYEWRSADFWGWDPAHATAAVEGYAASNQEFAGYAWKGEWAPVPPADRPRHVVPVGDFSPADANRLQRYLAEMAAAFRRLRLAEAGG